MSRSSANQRLRRIRAIVAASLGGVLVGLLGLFLATTFSDRKRLPELTPELFYAAKQRWESVALEDYDLQVQVTGRQAATYRVQVRGGQVVRATRNGNPLRQRRTQGTWSVDGMFGTIQSDVDNLEKHLSGQADQQTPQLLLRAVFHPKWGYPQKYHRTELRRWGNNLPVSWEVMEFKPVNMQAASDGKPPAP